MRPKHYDTGREESRPCRNVIRRREIIMDSARAGGLMAYGPDIQALFRGAAEHVDEILRQTRIGHFRRDPSTGYDAPQPTGMR
jgi:hypothetical protein